MVWRLVVVEGWLLPDVFTWFCGWFTVELVLLCLAFRVVSFALMVDLVVGLICCGVF